MLAFIVLSLVTAISMLLTIIVSRQERPVATPVPVQSGPRIGDLVPYADKRTENFNGRARIERFRRDGLITLRHGPCARQFSVHPSRILERS